MSSKSDIAGEVVTGSSSFCGVLDDVISNPNHLVGMEPEGSGWDFHDWTGHDFTKIENSYGIRYEKFFNLATVNNKFVAMRIVETDPQKWILRDRNLFIHYIVECVPRNSVFPTVIISKDSLNGEVILVQKLDSPVEDSIAKYFSNTECFGKLKSNSLVERGDKSWAYFLKEVLSSKQFFPNLFNPTGEMIREELDLDPSDPIREKDVLAAELEMVNQEVLGILYADFIME